MSRYRITVNSTGNGNPEFDPDEKLRNGMDVDGFMLLTFRNGEPHGQILMGVSVYELARGLAIGNTEADSAIRQATVIAEGLRKAEEIEKQDRRDRHARRLADMLTAKE